MELAQLAVFVRPPAEGAVKTEHERQFLDSLASIRRADSPDVRRQLADALRRGDREAAERLRAEIRGRSA